MLSRNAKTGQIEAKPVTATSGTVPTVLTLCLTDATTGALVETLTATQEHPFYVDGQGFVPAGRLAVGNAIVTRAGPRLIVQSVTWQRHPEGIAVYNFVVDEDHTYFVGNTSGGVWVHNPTTCPPGAAKVDLAEVKGLPVKAADVTNEWDNFLGAGPRTDLHPRLGIPDPNRIVTQTGANEWRSIRYGSHEIKYSHYHEETWTYDPPTNTVTIGNTYRPIH